MGYSITPQHGGWESYAKHDALLETLYTELQAKGWEYFNFTNNDCHWDFVDPSGNCYCIAMSFERYDESLDDPPVMEVIDSMDLYVINSKLLESDSIAFLTKEIFGEFDLNINLPND